MVTVVFSEGQYGAGYDRSKLTPLSYSKTPSLVPMNMSIFKDTHIQRRFGKIAIHAFDPSFDVFLESDKLYNDGKNVVRDHLITNILKTLDSAARQLKN